MVLVVLLLLRLSEFKGPSPTMRLGGVFLRSGPPCAMVDSSRIARGHLGRPAARTVGAIGPPTVGSCVPCQGGPTGRRPKRMIGRSGPRRLNGGCGCVAL